MAMKCKVTYRVLRKNEEVWIKKVGIQQGQQQWCQKVGDFNGRMGNESKEKLPFCSKLRFSLLYYLLCLALKIHHHQQNGSKGILFKMILKVFFLISATNLGEQIEVCKKIGWVMHKKHARRRFFLKGVVIGLEVLISLLPYLLLSF